MVPTPDELAAMPWHKRDKALLQLRSLMSAYGLAFEPARRTRMTEAQKARNAARRRKAAQAWGESVRAEARRLERESNRRAGVQR